MESANLGHLHPHEQQQFGGGSSIGLPSFHAVDSHLWSQNLSGSAPKGHVSLDLEDAVVTSSSKETQHQKNNQVSAPSTLNVSMFQDVGYQWDIARSRYMNSSINPSQLQKIKEELSGPFIKYEEPSHLGDLNLHSRNQDQYAQELIGRHLLRNFNTYPTSELSGTYDSHKNPNPENLHLGSSKIHPSSIISTLSPSASSLSCSLSSIDHMASMHNNWGSNTNIEGNFDEPTIFNQALIGAELPFGSSYMVDLNQDHSSGFCYSPKISNFLNGVIQTKRSIEACTSRNQPSSQPVGKKPRCSTPPFKKHIQVRKEKLGDRISALQQLVSPFGKTDTASVLMEAIGYIKFLQEQVETLSVPYMKSSTNSSSVSAQGAKKGGTSCNQERDKEPKRDLKSRGLCLVPLSCTSYVAEDIGVWSPPNFKPPI